MNRREFITLLGGASLAWPLAARAQQPGKLRTIGFSGQSTRSAESELVAAFTQRLRELGWIEGRTVTIEYRWSEGRAERFVQIAAEFVRLNVDVIVCPDGLMNANRIRINISALGVRLPTMPMERTTLTCSGAPPNMSTRFCAVPSRAISRSSSRPSLISL